MDSKYFLFVIVIVLISCEPITNINSLTNPTGLNSSLPRLYTDNETGEVFMSWTEEQNDTTTLYYSKFKEGWTTPVKISESDNWFINWADFPSVISRNGEVLAAHWLNKIPGHTYSYEVNIAMGSKFTKILTPHEDQTATEHGFVSMTPISDSAFYAIWLDGRNMITDHSGEFGDLSHAMTLRGAKISVDGHILDKHIIDESVCECCNTSIAKTDHGMIAAYRNRSNEEIRDIYVSRFQNGSWSKPEPVFEDNWQIAACPVNGPSIDVYNKSAGIAYFTSKNDSPIVKLAFSNDEGNSFNIPFEIDADYPVGRVDLIMEDEVSAWVSWITRDEDSAKLMLKHVSNSGQIMKSITVSEINTSRSSGFPQISKYKDGLIIAWTQINEDLSKSVKTAIVR